MKKSKKFQTLIYTAALLAVLSIIILIIDASEDIDIGVSGQIETVTADNYITDIFSEELTEKAKDSTMENALITDKNQPVIIDEIQNNTTVTEAELTFVTEAAQKKEAHYVFRSSKLLNQHYQEHGIDMGFSSAEEYEKAAEAVVKNPNSLHKIEAEDGDDVYYLEATNEFVIVSTDGYIRTYFNPDRGIDYYNGQ
ncbi:MAG: hypothetical protein NC203_02290 [Firmicutes bacterium]|nr:hypothetical protein [Bacillota bacterium]